MKLWETSTGSVAVLIERFTAGEDVELDARLLYVDLCGTAAHVRGLGRIGILDQDEVAAVCVELQRLYEARLHIKREDEDVHTAVENALTTALGELGEKVHTGRSRNDQVLVDLRLYTKAKLFKVVDYLLALAGAALDVARQHEFVPMPGATHTRWAMLSSVGLWAGSFVEGLLEDLHPLEAAFTLVDQCPLGAAAGYGVPLPLERDHVAHLLGFSRVQANTLGAISGRGKVDHAVLSALATVMLDLSRLASDLIWYSSDAMPFFQIPEAFCTGSSIMPNKHNPDVLELVRARAARVQAQAVTAFTISQGRVSGYHRDHQELKPALMDGLETTVSCLEVLVPLVSGLAVDAEPLARAIVPELFAVDHMLARVRAGEPLRQAYRKLKAHLDEVEKPDLEQALKARSHLGGTGCLDLEGVSESLSQQVQRWGARQSAFEATLQRLIERG